MTPGVSVSLNFVPQEPRLPPASWPSFHSPPIYIVYYALIRSPSYLLSKKRLNHTPLTDFLSFHFMSGLQKVNKLGGSGQWVRMK